MNTPSPHISRRRGGALVIDFRACPPAEIEDLQAFEGLPQRLEELGASDQVRAWVLHDQVVTWTQAALPLLEGLGALWSVLREAPEAAGEVMILPPGAAACPALVQALGALGLPAVALRRAGGLPLEEVTLEKRTFTTLTASPLIPTEPAPLRALFEQMDPAMEAPILDYLDGLLDRWGRWSPESVTANPA